MTTRDDGGIDCDSCGRDVGAGSLLLSVHVGDVDPDNVGQVRNMRFCRPRPEDPEGFTACSVRLLEGMTDHRDRVTRAAREELAARAEREAAEATPIPTTPPAGTEETPDA